jgi:deoxyribodipyrimidine photolyase-related protein
MKQNPKVLRLILGDQLNQNHSWFKDKNDNVLYVLMEVHSEAQYVKHHIQKLVAFFSAMRSFAEWLKSAGHRVEYLNLDAKHNAQNFTDNISALIKQYQITLFEYQLPDEYRLDQILQKLQGTLQIAVHCVDSEHFLTTREYLAQHFSGKKEYLMESFYRAMRRRYQILMDGDQPESGQWNFDHDNRKKLPKDLTPPAALTFDRDVSAMVSMIKEQKIEYIGTINPSKFAWPINRREALKSLNYFCEHLLEHFGDYQDAMHIEHRNLFHSRLSFALNIKLLSPLEVIERVIKEWRKHPKKISLQNVEGFVRQILGWREYMRGVYWAHMPAYAELNYFQHRRPLPAFYWSGTTKMNCLHHAIDQSLHDAYAHHIQRLMITGNFALLAGIDPTQLDAWYLGIYIDAIEWVEITNTRGMSQYADGGIVGTKPYASTANYIHKMSNYCSSCHYDREKRYGERACPFNSLYWNFYETHKDKLAKNPRNSLVYRQLEKMPSAEKSLVLKQAHSYLHIIDEL